MTEKTTANERAKERRNFRRIHFDAKTTLMQAEKEWDAPLIDISLKGALIEIPAALNADFESPFELNIALGENQSDTIIISCRAAHREPGRLGVEIDYVDIDSATHLKRLIELNIADQDAMQRELSTLIEVNAAAGEPS